MALTPGGVDQKLEKLNYKRIKRPMHPIDLEMKDPDLRVWWISNSLGGKWYGHLYASNILSLKWWN